MGRGRFRAGVKGVELAVEDTGDVALQGPMDLPVAMAFLGTFGDVVPGSGIMSHPGHGDGMQCSIETPITTPIESVPDSFTA